MRRGCACLLARNSGSVPACLLGERHLRSRSGLDAVGETILRGAKRNVPPVAASTGGWGGGLAPLLA